MPIPITPKPPFPNVPPAAGVPPLPRPPNQNFGTVALLAADRDEANETRPEVARSELVLSRAGFGYQTIASLTGKKPEAIRSFLRRQKPE